MIFSNIDFAVVYVDPSRETAGDGSTPETALKDLPATLAEFADGTCYLIRRTAAGACVMPSGTRSDILNLIVAGMPKPDDLLYDIVPDAAKSAWGMDSAEHANVKNISGSSASFGKIRNFLLHRVYLFRENSTANSYIFNFTESSSFYANFLFQHCRFGYAGYELDAADFTTAAPYNAARMCNYIGIYYANLCSITDCAMNFDAYAHGIYCYYAKIVQVENVAIQALATSRSNSYRALCLSDRQEGGIEATVRGLTANIWFNGTAQYVPCLLQLMDYQQSDISEITVTMNKALDENRPASLIMYGYMFYFYYLRDFSVTDVSISLPHLWNIQSGASVFRMERCYTCSQVPGCVHEVRNLAVTLAEADGIGESNSYDEVKSSSNSSYQAVYLDFRQTETSNYWKAVEVENITVKHPRGRALYAAYCRLGNCTLSGTAVFVAALADVNSLSSWFPGYALYACDSSTVRVRNLAVNLSNPTYPALSGDPAIGSTYSDYSFVFVDESNVAIRPLENNSDYRGKNYIGFVGNNEAAAGHFVQRNPLGLCDTWNVSRTGGSPACLKLWNNTYNSETDMMILGRRPFNGMELLPETTGRHCLKLHIAYKGIADASMLYRQLMLSATVQGATQRRVFWSAAGQWQEDAAAIWNNDSDLTQKMLVLPLEWTETSVVNVRIYFNWYSPAGFVYIDPAVELEQVEQ